MALSAHEPGELSGCAAAVDAVAGAFAEIFSDVPGVAIPATQLRVLLAVERRGTVNLSGLAADLGALMSSASRLCDRLEAAGLVARTPGRRSRREVMIRLTADGLELLERLRRHRRDRLMRVLALMAPADRDALLTGLTRFDGAAGMELTIDRRRSVRVPA